MKYMLDTNVCIYFLNGKNDSLKEILRNIDPNDLFVSSITVGKLMYEVFNSQRIQENHLAVVNFLGNLNLLDFDSESAIIYGRIRADLKKEGHLIGPNDLFIAAHALSNNMTLVTNNEKEFKRVKGLKISNWAS